LGPWKGPPG